MKALQSRVRRLEDRYGVHTPLPWERPGWEQLSDDAQLDAIEDYCAAYPDSRFAQQMRALEAMSDRELEELIEATQAMLEDSR